MGEKKFCLKIANKFNAVYLGHVINLKKNLKYEKVEENEEDRKEVFLTNSHVGSSCHIVGSFKVSGRTNSLQNSPRLERKGTEIGQQVPG